MKIKEQLTGVDPLDTIEKLCSIGENTKRSSSK